jgi:membrane peptidoglycan carboxypeptidase
MPGQGRGLPGRYGGGGSGRGGGRRKGDWWRHWTWKKAASVGAAVCAAIAMLGAGAVGMAYAKTPIPDPQAAATQAASTVYFSNGKTLVGQFGTYDRQPLTLAQIPPVLQNAVVAAEDKNFYHEGGVSPTGILRAAYYDLTSSGGNLQGGSTITQQLVRNFYTDIGTAQTMSRKIKEIFVAEKLARARSKQWILQEYLNTVYFGQGAYGVGAAASVYFGLTPATLHEITPAQAAMIAAMIQSPSYYTPNPKGGAAYHALVSRWQYVLGAMVKMGTISQQQANQALAKFPAVVKPINNSWSGYNGYIMQAVLYELQNTYHYSKQQVFNGGLRITTTFSQRLMKSLYATVRANQALMRHATPPSPPGGPTVACGPKGCLPWYVHVGALLEDPATGAVLAMYSGKNYNHTAWDDALQSPNQVGSSFKPYVLATAVSQGMNVMTSKLNGYAPLWIPPDSQPMTFASLHNNNNAASWYQVANDEVSNPNRPVSVTEATAMSLNTSYADLWHRVALNPATGAHSVVNMAKSFGVDIQRSGLWTMRDEAGTALGQASLTVEEQANTIATLADNGVYHAPHMIKEIQVGGQTIHARIPSHVVLNPEQAAEVDYAMSFDDSPMGTASGLGLTNGQKIIAKTGTTNLAQSAFFMGATPRYAMAVGMFVSHPGCTLPTSQQGLCTSTAALSYTPPSGLETLYGVGGEAGYGGQWPAIIWHSFFMKNFNGLSVQPWPALPANFGSAWNLVDPKMIIKPRPHPRPSFSPPCFGNGRKCRPTPGPTLPLGCPPVCPTSSPSISPTLPPTAGAVAGAAAGGLVVGGLVAGGLATSGLATGWLPGRRRRSGRQAGNRDS